MFNKFRILFLSTLFLLYSFIGASFAPVGASISEQPCSTYSWSEEDDVAHQMSLPYSLPLGSTTYDTVYVTTNGTLTFGTPDSTFHTYPSTSSISLAGWDWVTWGGGYLSYGVTDTGFCVEWKVRPYPESSGDFTTIKLTVDISRLPTWSGIVETTGWLPQDLRRGIRFESNQDVVVISEAFTINGGVPVEMQTCWDGTIIPMSGTCPAEPPLGECWDGSTVAYNQTCPPVPPDTQCWNGTWVAWSQTCPQQPAPIECWDGSEVNYDQQCSPVPDPVVSPTPEPTQTIAPTPEPTVTPEPSPSETPTIEPTLEPSPEPSPSQAPVESPAPAPSESLTSLPLPSSPEPVEPSPTFVPEDAEPSFTPTPSQEPIIEPEIPIDFDEPFTKEEVEEFISDLLSDGNISQEEVNNLLENLTEDGVLTQGDKELLVSVIIAQADGEAVSSELIDELGLDYEDLPPDQLVILSNGVVLTAEVLDAIEIFESPSELLATIFSDPSKTVKALLNVGADMTEEKREEAQTVVVAAIIVTQVAAIASVASSGSTSSSGSTGAGVPAGEERVRKSKKRVIKKTPKNRKIKR